MAAPVGHFGRGTEALGPSNHVRTDRCVEESGGGYSVRRNCSDRIALET